MAAAALDETLDVGHALALGLGEVIAVKGFEHRPPRVQIEVQHQIGTPHVQVDRALVDGRVGAAGLDRAQHLTRGSVDEDEAVGRRRSQRDAGGGVIVGPPEHEPGRSLAQQPGLGQCRGVLVPLGAEDRLVGVTERRLVGGAEQVLGVDLTAVGIEDGRLHGPAEEVIGMAAEELIQGVLARDVDGQARVPAGRLAPTSGAGWPPCPETSRTRRRRARRCRCPARARPWSRHAEQLPAGQAPLDLVPLGGV